MANARLVLDVERAVHLDAEPGLQALLRQAGPLPAVFDLVDTLGSWPILVGARVVWPARTSVSTSVPGPDTGGMRRVSSG